MFRRLLILFTVVILAAVSGALSAGEAAGGNPPAKSEDVPTELIVPLLAPPPALKGDLSDPVWVHATHVSGFIDDKDPRKRLSPRSVELFLFHDDDALYVGMKSRTPFGRSLVIHQNPRDGAKIYYDDNCEICLLPPGVSPIGAKEMYQFIISAGGDLYDGTYCPSAGFWDKWDSKTTAVANVTPNTFSIEMRIPIESMRPDEKISAGDRWRFTAVRNYRFEPVWFQDHLTSLKTGFADWDRFARLIMAGDSTAVDVDLSGGASGRPVFRIVSRGADGTFGGSLADVRSNKTIASQSSTDVSNGGTGELSAILKHADGDMYRADLSLLRKSDGTPLARLSREFSTLPPLRLTTDIDCVKQTVTVQVDAQGVYRAPGNDTLPAVLEVEKKDDPRVLLSKTFDVEPGQVSVVTLPIADLKDGVHLIDCSVRDKTGYLVAKAVEPVRIYKDLYWLNNGLGEEDVVPRPFTKPVYGEIDRTLQNWEHKLVLGRSVLPEQILVEGAPLLAAPIRFEGMVNGKPWLLNAPLKRVNSSRVSGIELKGESETGEVQTKVRLNFEYDGMLRVDMSIGGKKPVRIDKLSIRIPMRRDAADMLANIGAPHLAEGTTAFEGMTMLKNMDFAKEMYYTDLFEPSKSGPGKWDKKRFWPILWISDMDRGLCWFTESDEAWNVAAGHDIYSLEKDSKKTELVINMVDTPLTVPQWNFTFGLQAFPARPWDKSVEREMWGTRTEHYAAMADARDAETAHSPDSNTLFVTNPAVGSLGADNPLVQRQLIMDPWVVMHHAPDEGWQREIFRRVEEYWSKNGRRMFIYNNSNYTWWNSPEYKYFKALWGMGGETGQFPEWEMIEVNRACKNWQDYWIYHFYYMLKRYPENIFSIDCSVIQSDNKAINGMGYTKNGKRYPTLNIFETRRMYKRIYVIANKLRSNPITLLSASGYWTPMTMSFGNITESGEEWRGWQRHQFEAEGRNMDLFRYLCASRVGPVRGFLDQVAWNEPWSKTVHAQGICLLHNIYYQVVYHKVAGSDIKLFKRMGMGVREDMTFHPYWKAQPEIKCDQSAFRTSFWTHPGGASFVIVNTDWEKAASGTLEIDTSAIGLKHPRISLFDALANTLTELPAQDGSIVKVKLDIPSALFDIILLEEK